MSTSNDTLSQDPDLFASEIHFCLLNDGIRSRALRRLGRLARGNSELERILEIKVSEFRRALREMRVPTLWNLPTRAFEWLVDDYRFMPPREALTTLAYVAVVLVGVDALKTQVPWPIAWGDSGRHQRITLTRPSYELNPDLIRTPIAAASETPSHVEEWLARELKQAAESTEWSQLISKRLSASLEALPLDDLVARRIEHMLESGKLQDILSKQMQQTLESQAVSPESTLRTNASLAEAVNTAESRQMMQQALGAIAGSEDFKKLLAASLQKTLESAEFQQSLKTAAADPKAIVTPENPMPAGVKLAVPATTAGEAP